MVLDFLAVDNFDFTRRGVFDSLYKQSTESFRNWPHHFHWGIGLCQSLENSEDPEGHDLNFDPALDLSLLN